MSISKNSHPIAVAIGILLASIQIEHAAWAQSLPKTSSAPNVSTSRIKALVFLPTPEKIAARGLSEKQINPAADGALIDVSQSPVLQDARFIKLMSKLIGQPLTTETIEQIGLYVNAFLQNGENSLAYVSVPPQDASSGVVQVLVLQPKLGTLKVEGASVFPEDSYRAAIRQQPGQQISQATLDEDLAWIGRSNPYRSAVAVAAPGAKPGETDITIRVTEQKPWSVRIGADNTGTQSTQRERVSAAATTANAFGLGHIASYSLSANPDFKNFVGHGLSYTVPLSWRDILSFSASYATIKARMPAPLDSTGYSGGAGMRYEKFLPRVSAAYTHSAIFGIDYKIASTNLLFSSVPVFDNRTDIVQLVAGYNGALQDAYGNTSFNATWTYSPGGLTSNNNDARFAASRAQAKARYHYATLTADRMTKLPQGWSWTVNARAQIANQNLLGSEQLAVAGTYGVRGYEEGAYYADRGVIVRNEFGPAALNFGMNTEARFYGFVDGAWVSNVNPVAGEQGHEKLASAGFGAKLSVNRALSMRIEIGHRLLGNIAGRSDDATQGHLSLNYQF
jgi:hemolysin activation/secretion protein